MKRMTLLALALCLLAGLTGCASPESGGSQQIVTSSQTAETPAPTSVSPSLNPERQKILAALSGYFPNSLVKLQIQGENTVITVEESAENLDPTNTEQWTAWKDSMIAASCEAPIQDTAAMVVYLMDDNGNISLTAVGGSILYDASEEPEESVNLSITPSYMGAGDDVISISGLDSMWAMHISGNDTGRHFAVTAYDASGNYLDLLVNTTEPYNGVVIDPSQTAAYLEIKAEGVWQVEQIYLRDVSMVNAGTLLTGTGDAVIQTDVIGDTIEIAGNSQNRHFAVKAYNISTGEYDLLVNTTEEYAGKVMVDFDPTYLVVTAEGAWTIQF